MYDGMTSVLSSSLPLENVHMYDVSPGVCGYNFTLPLTDAGLTLSWSMDDDRDKGQNYYDFEFLIVLSLKLSTDCCPKYS